MIGNRVVVVVVPRVVGVVRVPGDQPIIWT